MKTCYSRLRQHHHELACWPGLLYVKTKACSHCIRLLEDCECKIDMSVQQDFSNSKWGANWCFYRHLICIKGYWVSHCISICPHYFVTGHVMSKGSPLPGSAKLQPQDKVQCWKDYLCFLPHRYQAHQGNGNITMNCPCWCSHSTS